MEEIKKKIQFITCPICEGTGKNKYGLACSNCDSLGMGAFDNSVFYYWGPKLGLAVIKLDNIRKKVNKAINLFSLVIGLVGLIALGWWIFESSKSGEIESLYFWQNKHWLLLFFWISLIFDMFVFYRLSEEEAGKNKIKEFNKNKLNKELPDNWRGLKKYRLKVDVATGYSFNAMKVIENSYMLARNLGHRHVKIMHLFYAMFKDKSVLAFFSRLNINKENLVKKIENRISMIKEDGRTELSNEVKKVFIGAYLLAQSYNQKNVNTLNFIIPAMANNKILSEILYELGLDDNKINNCLAWFRINDKLVEQYRNFRSMARLKPGANMDKAYTAIATPVLNHFGYDLTAAAKWGRLDFIVARDKEIKNVFQQFESGHTGVILTGEEGIGKNAIVEGIAQLMVEEKVPKILNDKRLVRLDVSRLVSGATASQAQERLLAIIDEVVRSGNIILYIKNLENIIGITSGGEESLDLSEVLTGAIERKSLYCIASANVRNYIKYIEERPIGNVMSKIRITEPEENEAIQIIESKIGPLEAKYKVYFSYHAIESIVKLSQRYMHDKYLPDKAINLIELVSVKVAQEKGEGAVVTKEDIGAIVSEETNIPVSKVTEDEGDVLLNLEETIHNRMINQEEAVKMVSSSLRRARAQLSEGKRPIASFLFLGPTGVGKTELAKSVADIYFGNEKNMIRVDMSEYKHIDSIKKMIGSSGGDRGYLTEAVRKAPFSLVLLDEFEKAHPDILNLFLQVMDDGRLTDGQGRTINFTNTIIISTSNADAVYIQDEVGKGTPIEKIKEVIINERLNKILRPELINRFDGVVIFKPLSEENIVDIARLMLQKFEKTLKKKGIRMRAEEDGIRILARQGYDVKYGARPMRRLLQDKVEDMVANKILEEELQRRDTVVVDKNGEIKIEKREKL